MKYLKKLGEMVCVAGALAVCLFIYLVTVAITMLPYLLVLALFLWLVGLI